MESKVTEFKRTENQRSGRLMCSTLMEGIHQNYSWASSKPKIMFLRLLSSLGLQQSKSMGGPQALYVPFWYNTNDGHRLLTCCSHITHSASYRPLLVPFCQHMSLVLLPHCTLLVNKYLIVGHYVVMKPQWCFLNCHIPHQVIKQDLIAVIFH